MKRLTAIAATVLATLGGPVLADSPVVVELYTSQGCSSCPPADKILGQLAEKDNVIALALHVDYWDYIGWKDEFADPAHTKRQRAYARAAGERTIYTPQMVIGGQTHVVGSRAMKVSEAVNKHARVDLPVEVKLKRSGNKLIVNATAESRIKGAVIHVVTYQDDERVKITRGENAGRTLTYHNIVQDWVTVGKWNGQGDYSTSVSVPKNVPVAVLFQAPNAGPILGASRLN